MILRLWPILTTFTLAQNAALPSVLIYSRTAGFRHDSIPTAVDALRNMAAGLYNPVFSEAPADFTIANLSQFKALIFLSNSDQVLTPSGESALDAYLRSGGNLIGGLVQEERYIRCLLR